MTPDDLPPWMIRSHCFHMVCSPARCIEMVTRLLQLRKMIDLPPSASSHGLGNRPFIIWEPVPDRCIPEELDNTFEALKYVDIVSPNHQELAGLFGFQHGTSIDRNIVSSQAKRFLSIGVGSGSNDQTGPLSAGLSLGSVVVRCGKEGCFYAGLGLQAWLPAYHQDAERVVDPTGGGNGFLGGLAIGYLRAIEQPPVGKLREACLYATVAASFCIEQVGVPKLTTKQTNEADETWNGVSVMERLAEYRRRTTFPPSSGLRDRKH